jgi:hypothetical protein
MYHHHNFLLLIYLIKSIFCEPRIYETFKDVPIKQSQPLQIKQDFYNLQQPPNYFPPNSIFPGANYPTFNNYYPPTNSYPTWNYCIPPQLSPTYYVCPEPFYFFQYEPLLTSNMNEAERKAKANKFSSYFYAQSPQAPPPSQYPPFFLSKPTEYPEYQAQTAPNITAQPLGPLLDGPIWEILKQTYEKCCPLNRNRLKPIQTRDEISLYQRLFNSYGKLNNTLQGQGIYGIIENFDAFQSLDSTAQNPSSVQILSSSGMFFVLVHSFFFFIYFEFKAFI